MSVVAESETRPLTLRGEAESPRCSVTVGITTYQGASFLREAVASILEQTARDFELIVVDDGSSDESVKLIREFRDPRIRVYENFSNMGISASRNRLLSLAEGEYFAALDQDDVSFPRRLEHQVAFLDAHSEVVLVSSPVMHLRRGRLYRDPMPVHKNPAALHMALFFGRHNITYSATCFRLSRLQEHGVGFRPEFHYAEDFEIYHRLAKIGKLAMLEEPLVAYRVHGENTSVTRYREMTKNGQRFLNHAYADLLCRDVSADEIGSLWRLAVEGRAARTRSELARVGALIKEVLEVFEKRCGEDAEDLAAVRKLAGQVWWSIVRASTGALGRHAIAEGRAWDELSTGAPPAYRRAWWYVTSRTLHPLRQLRHGRRSRAP